jgi:hypothetical protein
MANNMAIPYLYFSMSQTLYIKKNFIISIYYKIIHPDSPGGMFIAILKVTADRKDLTP